MYLGDKSGDKSGARSRHECLRRTRGVFHFSRAHDVSQSWLPGL